MSVSAYITAGQTVIPALLPTKEMVDTARQIGIPETDLFTVDIPAGMSRYTRASVLIASTQLSTLYGVSSVTLTLTDGSARTITLSDLTARPPQPFFWGQQGGVVMVELVDHRWNWRFSIGAQHNTAVVPTWSSDGRWQVNGTEIASWDDLLNAISLNAFVDGLTMPVGLVPEAGQYIRRLSDFFGTPNVSLAVMLDAIGVANSQVIVSTGSSFRYVQTSSWKSTYDSWMNTYGLAYRGGMQPVNASGSSSDPLVSLWNTYGYAGRCPPNASVILPRKRVEGQTVYDNCTIANTPVTDSNFAASQVELFSGTPSWGRAPTQTGRAYLPDSSVTPHDGNGALLTSAPGWNPTPMASYVRDQYANRYSNIPFGRTVWAGWVPWYSGPTSHIGQAGLVCYRLAFIDGEWAPVTISEAKEDDWLFGPDGTAISDPTKIVTGKGLNVAYRNCVGATIIDAAPPNTRVFPARITASEQFSTWCWWYSFEEVEPKPGGETGNHPCVRYVSMGDYARKSTTFGARNMCEEGNVYVGAGNAGNVIAPGVAQSAYTNATISALPISVGTIVEMVEQFPTVYTGTGQTPSVAGPQYWFSMPNAVRVVCNS